jgi:hypothetical protein
MIMRYAIANLGTVEIPRYVPAGPVDCSNVEELKRARDNAAWRLSAYNDAIRQAAGNDPEVDVLAAKADLAAKDWDAMNKVLKTCSEVPAAAAPVAAPSSVDWTKVGIGVVVVGLGVGLLVSHDKAITAWSSFWKGK